MKTLPALLLIFALSGCGPVAAPMPSEHHIGESIREHEVAMLAAMAAEDAEAVAAFYEADAQMLSPGVAHTTPNAIRTAFQGLFDDPDGSITFQNTEMIIPASGDYAVSQGTYLATYSDPVAHQRASQAGNYINVWRRQEDGSWKIVRDITAPAPAETRNP